MYATLIGSDVQYFKRTQKNLLWYAPLRHVLKRLVVVWTYGLDMFHNIWCLFNGLFYKSIMHIFAKWTVFAHVLMVVESEFYSNYLYVVYLQLIEILCAV